MVNGSGPVDGSRSGDGKGAELPFAQDTSPPEQFAQRRKQRMVAHEAASEEVAAGTLRGLLAYIESCECTDWLRGAPLRSDESEERATAAGPGEDSGDGGAWRDSGVSNLRGGAIFCAGGGGGEGYGGCRLGSPASPNRVCGDGSVGEQYLAE